MVLGRRLPGRVGRRRISPTRGPFGAPFFVFGPRSALRYDHGHGHAFPPSFIAPLERWELPSSLGLPRAAAWSSRSTSGRTYAILFPLGFEAAIRRDGRPRHQRRWGSGRRSSSRSTSSSAWHGARTGSRGGDRVGGRRGRSWAIVPPGRSSAVEQQPVGQQPFGSRAGSARRSSRRSTVAPRRGVPKSEPWPAIPSGAGWPDGPPGASRGGSGASSTWREVMAAAREEAERHGPGDRSMDQWVRVDEVREEAVEAVSRGRRRSTRRMTRSSSRTRFGLS